jgi:hypothetical protein
MVISTRQSKDGATNLYFIFRLPLLLWVKVSLLCQVQFYSSLKILAQQVTLARYGQHCHSQQSSYDKLKYIKLHIAAHHQSGSKTHACKLLVTAHTICYTHWITHQRSPWCWNMRAACCWEHSHQLLQRTELKQFQHGVKCNVNVINKNNIYTLSKDNIHKVCLIHTGLVPFSNSVDTSATFTKSDANGA